MCCVFAADTQIIRRILQDFNSNQRSSFCVYSGKGVSELREFLADLFNTVTDELNGGSGTEYDDDDDGYVRDHMHMDIIDDEDEDEDDEDEDEAPLNGTITFVNHQNSRTSIPHQTVPVDVQPHITAPPTNRELSMSRDRASVPVARHSVQLHNGNIPHIQPVSPTPGPPRRSRGFGHLPIIEASTSPTPSEAASNRSGGTNHSTGTAFFRNYNDATHQQTRAGVITPDLVFAEIGHGRGADGASHQSNGRWSSDSVVLVSPPHSASYGSLPLSVSAHGMYTDQANGFNTNIADSPNAFHRPSPRTDAGSSSWTLIPEPVTGSTDALLPGRERQDSAPDTHANGQETDSRGRHAKRGLRNTFTSAEQFASSFFFGRVGANGHPPEGPSGSSSRHRSVEVPGPPPH